MNRFQAGPDDLVLRSATIATGGPLAQRDLLIRDGRVASISESMEIDCGEATWLDLDGFLLLGAPAEPHAHLDKAYCADLAVNQSGDLGGAIEAWLRYREAMSPDDVAGRADAAVRAYLSRGITAIRSHVDVDASVGLLGLRAVAGVRETVSERCDLQLVAFAGVPLSGRAGRENRAVLREALAMGADVVGTCPTFDPDPVACVDVCLDLAAEYRVPVDLHVDETLDTEPCTLAMLADAVLRRGFPYGVVASHCVSLAMMDQTRAEAIAERVAAAGITVVCLPATNLFLQGRSVPIATPRGLTALATLRRAGVRVAAGGDNMQDPFHPLGGADPFHTAALLVLAGHESVESGLAAVSGTARFAMGLPDNAIQVGSPAELVAVRAASPRQAIAEAVADRIVIHGGRVVARTETRTEFPRWTGSRPAPSHSRTVADHAGSATEVSPRRGT